jgi:GNAT superfamily N-acetyltransferase
VDLSVREALPIFDRLVLRGERQQDEAFLRTLYASTRADELAYVPLDAAQVDAFLRMQFDLQRAHYRRHFPAASFLIVELDGRPIGRLYVHYTPADVRVLDIALMPDRRGQGVGTWRPSLSTLRSEASRDDSTSVSASASCGRTP